MTELKRRILLITVIAAAIMELIDTSIVNVALNYMSGNLGATLEDVSWVVTAYAIANVIIIPMTSFLVANLGRRNYYIGSILLFTTCSLLCGNASSIWGLVAFRFLQGLGGGALLSVSAMVVYELFPKEKQATASALFGIGVFIGPTIGPTLGGYITEHYSWPWIFYINLPIGIVAALCCQMLLPEPPVKQPKKKIDWPGIILLIVGIGSLQTVLERGQTEDWFDTCYIVVLSVVAILSSLGFVYRELNTGHPVVNLRVLANRPLAISTLLTFITGMGMFTSVYLTPVLAQRLLGFTPTQAGMLLLPGSIVAIVALVASGKLLQRGVAPSLIVLAGFGCFIYFNWLMSRISPQVPGAMISANLIFRAIGMALLTVPLSTLAVSTLAPKDMQQGTALNNMMRQLGGSFGIAIINTYLARRLAVHRLDLVTRLSTDNPLAVSRLNAYTTAFHQKGFGWDDAHQRSVQLMEQVVNKQSSFMSFLDGYLLIGLFFVAALPLLLVVARRDPRQPVRIASADH